VPPDSPANPSPTLEPVPLLTQRRDDPQFTIATTTGTSIYIIGYSVKSKNISSNNGWWKISRLDRFGIKDGRIEFWAMAAKWYSSKARFDVQVWYAER
jgi:hypothetical protein